MRTDGGYAVFGYFFLPMKRTYTNVAVAQATALNARQSLITLQGQRLAASVSLIEALGGGWSTTDLPK